VGLNPVVVRNLLILTVFVEPTDLLVGRLFLRGNDTFFLHEAHHVSLPALARIAADDRLHRGVGFQRRGINADRLARQELLLRRDLQDELKDFRENLRRQTAAS